MRVRVQGGKHLGLTVVDVEEEGTLAELLESAHIPGAFTELTILERHAGEIGTPDAVVIVDERYFIISGLPQ